MCVSCILSIINFAKAPVFSSLSQLNWGGLLPSMSVTSKVQCSYFPLKLYEAGFRWQGCSVFYRYATSHPINGSAVWSVMCHVPFSSSEMSSLMSPCNFGEENTTSLFPIKLHSASQSLAWQRQKLFVLLGICVCMCVDCICTCLPLPFFVLSVHALP